MSLHAALAELADTHRLDADALRRLYALAHLHEEPEALARGLPRGLAVLGAALAGFGLVMGVAANWAELDRFGQFGLVMAGLAAAGFGAAAWPRGRVPLALLALIATGVLFALIGQVYQSGADPWQLFALWTVLTLPMALGARSEVLWAPWTLVAMTALSTWASQFMGSAWRGSGAALGATLLAWLIAFGLNAALGLRGQRWTGAGLWSRRLAALMSTGLVFGGAMLGLFGGWSTGALYPAGLLVLGVAAAWLCRPASFDVFSLSVVALAVVSLLVAGLARAMFSGGGAWNDIGSFLLLGLVAAGLLAAAVTVILRVSRAQAATSEVRHD
jgi:hypothetical protein